MFERDAPSPEVHPADYRRFAYQTHYSDGFLAGIHLPGLAADNHSAYARH